MDTNMKADDNSYVRDYVRPCPALDLLRMREVWTDWRLLAYAIGRLLHLPYDWLEWHTIVDQEATMRHYKEDMRDGVIHEC
jgi:hypothetical protein